VVADLEKAAALMENGERRGVEYASKEAAWALLSRAYLYMDQWDKAIEYAGKAIASPLLTLTPKTGYLDMFWNTPKSSESIFVIKHLLQDDLADGSIGSMYLTDGIGWGEVYVSDPLRLLLEEHPEDVRNTLIKPQYEEDGVTVAERNGIPKYFITKFSYQDGIVTLSSPHVVRLAEMYLNRAEAYAKKGQDQLALDDINVIRRRAGIADEDLYT
jgi:tetratricopeptide (TPR) repeat protein